MVTIKIKLNVLVAFTVLILAVTSAYFLISIELTSVPTSTTLPKTRPFTTSTTTTTIPASLRKRLLELANRNIQGKCNVTYSNVERKHFPASRWFSDLCPSFKDYNKTEMWRTDAYLNGECNLDEEHGCIEVFTSISLDERLVCVWAIEHPYGGRITFKNLTQKYC